MCRLHHGRMSIAAVRPAARHPAPRRRGVRRDRAAGRLEDARRAGGRSASRRRPSAPSSPSSSGSACSRTRTPRRAASPTEARLPPLRRRAARAPRAAAGRVRARACRPRAPRSRRRCRRRPRCSRRSRGCSRSSRRRRSRRRPSGTSRCCCSSPSVVMVVVITSTGGVTKQRYTFPEPVDPGLVDLGGRVPERARRRARGSARALLALALRRAEPRPARARVPRRDPRRRSTQVGRRAAAVRRRRRRPARRAARRGDRRVPQPDGARSRSAPRCSTCSRSRLDPRRPFARVGDELEQPGLRELALVGAAYGLAHQRARHGQPARPAAHGLREGAALRPLRGARAVALRRESTRRTTTPLP